MIGGPVWEAYGHTERVFDVRFQPSTSDLFASASEDCTVRVWRDVGARRYKQVLCCKSHESEVLRLGWSGDGCMLASGSADRTVRVWKAPEQGQPASYCSAPLACLSGHPEEVYHVEFVSPAPLSPPTPSFPSTPPISSQCHLVRESHLLVASSESLFLWDLDEGLLQQQADAPGTSGSTMPADLAAVIRHASSAAAAAAAPAAAVPADYHAAAAAAALLPEAVASGYQHAYIFSCAVQPTGGGGGGGGGSHRLVAAGCSDGQLRLWALSQSGLTWVGSCPLGAGRGPALITATLFSADGGQLAVVTRDGSVAVMDMRHRGQLLSSFRAPGGCLVASSIPGCNLQQQQQQQADHGGPPASDSGPGSWWATGQQQAASSTAAEVLLLAGQDGVVCGYSWDCTGPSPTPLLRLAPPPGTPPSPSLALHG
ncbi:hypothetical protein QJQ45_024757, partial [Haematococcus lacustris]